MALSKSSYGRFVVSKLIDLAPKKQLAGERRVLCVAALGGWGSFCSISPQSSGVFSCFQLALAGDIANTNCVIVLKCGPGAPPLRPPLRTPVRAEALSPVCIILGGVLVSVLAPRPLRGTLILWQGCETGARLPSARPVMTLPTVQRALRGAPFGAPAAAARLTAAAPRGAPTPFFVHSHPLSSRWSPAPLLRPRGAAGL